MNSNSISFVRSSNILLVFFLFTFYFFNVIPCSHILKQIIFIPSFTGIFAYTKSAQFFLFIFSYSIKIKGSRNKFDVLFCVYYEQTKIFKAVTRLTKLKLFQTLSCECCLVYLSSKNKNHEIYTWRRHDNCFSFMLTYKLAFQVTYTVWMMQCVSFFLYIFIYIFLCYLSVEIKRVGIEKGNGNKYLKTHVLSQNIVHNK